MVQSQSVIAWRASAKRATFSEADQQAIVHQVEATVFPDAASAWRITAARGVIDRATGNMALEGRVRLQQRDGYTIETDELHWDTTKRVLFTDAPVTMRSASVFITGNGLYSQMGQHRLSVQHGVRATFRLWDAR
jgi:LPS export ABC transporter protein LptC